MGGITTGGGDIHLTPSNISGITTIGSPQLGPYMQFCRAPAERRGKMDRPRTGRTLLLHSGRRPFAALAQELHTEACFFYSISGHAVAEITVRLAAGPLIPAVPCWLAPQLALNSMPLTGEARREGKEGQHRLRWSSGRHGSISTDGSMPVDACPGAVAAVANPGPWLAHRFPCSTLL